MHRFLIIVTLLCGFMQNATAQTDGQIAMCDVWARVAARLYAEKENGISYDDALAALPVQTNIFDQLPNANPERSEMIRDIVHSMLKKAYTTSWPNEVAFGDDARDICLQKK